jgi:long-chain acyl-CoA synthetase
MGSLKDKCSFELGKNERILNLEKGDTWPKILKYNYEKYGQTKKAMRKKRFGIWEPFTWKDYYLKVKYLALGLLSLGFEAGDKLLIIGDNSPEWFYAELACQTNHGISVGLDADLTPSEIKYFAKNSEARFAFVQDQEQVDKFLQILDDLPLLKRIIYWNYKGLAHYHESILIGLKEVIHLGEKYETEYPGIFEKNLETGNSEDICSIVYTAGTTGLSPKGVIHTFKSLMINAENQLSLDPWLEKDNLLPYLPPVGITEKLFLIGCHLLSGCTLNFAEEPETRERDIKEISPDIVFYGARIWEQQASAIQARILGGDALKKFFFQKLMPIGYRIVELNYKKQKPTLHLKMLYWLAKLILFNPIKRAIGLSKARLCYCTGSILSPEVFKFYHALDLPLKSVYETTEGGILTGVKNDEITFETVGQIYPGTDLRITAEGELIFRHPGIFIGYYKNPKETERVLKDGWFYSGDIGYIRDDGQLIILDRLNDIIQLENGKLLFPQSIECRLRFSPYIKDAWIVAGPEGKYVSAIIVINYNYVSRWAGQRRISYTTFTDLAQKDEVYELVKNDIERINKELSPEIRIKKYVNLHKEFNPDDGELTRTRNLRRKLLSDRYHELINAIYQGHSEIPIEIFLKQRDGRMGTIRTYLRVKSLEGVDE